MMAVVAPGNVISFFKVMIPVVMFDVLESIDYVQELYPDSDEISSVDSIVLDQMQDIGYDSYNPIKNMGTLFVLISGYVLQTLVLVFILYPLRLRHILQKETFKLIYRKWLPFNLFMLLFEGYIEYLISAWLCFEAPEGSGDKTLVL